MKLLSTLLIFILCTSSVALGQDGLELIRQGNEHFRKGEYIDAIRWYKNAVVEEKGDQAFAYFQLGNCYRFTFDYPSAEYNYQKSDEIRGARFIQAKFWYGAMLKLNGKYELALPVLEDFIDKVPAYFEDDPDLRGLYVRAKNEWEGCNLALTALSVPKPNYNLTVLPSPVNTDYNDFAPAFINGENEIQVTSARKIKKGAVVDYSLGENYTDLYAYSFNGSKWSARKSKGSLEGLVNTKLGEGTGVYNQEKTFYYYTSCEEDGGTCSLYYTKKVNGKWSEPTKLTRNVNTRGFTSKHPALSPSGDTLYFSSDKPGGMGGTDLWMSFSSNGVNWSLPRNLGKEINTPGDEISPFFDPVKKKLFFSSNGHRGFGGFDIFLSNGTSFEKTEIYNLGYPFNSNKDDVFAIFGQNKGYLSSNRVEGPGKFDIFVFDIKQDKEVIAEISVEPAIAGRNAMFSDDLDFDSQEYDLINDLVSVSLAAKLQGIDLVLSSVLQRFYDGLTLEDQQRIERIVGSRYRKVTDEELADLEIENEYFYLTSSKADREHITNMASKLIAEYGLSDNVDYDATDDEFFNLLNEGDRKKVIQVINNRIKKAEEYKIETANYDALDKRGKKNVDQIADMLIKEKKSLDELNLGFDNNAFIKSLSAEEKSKILESLKDKILLLADDKNNELTDEDKEFYKNLTEEHLNSIRHIANSFLLSDAEHLGQFLAKEDIAYYNILGKKQQGQVDRIVIKMIKNTYLSDLLYTESSEISKNELSRLKDNVSGANSLDEMLASISESSAGSNLNSRDKNRLLRFLSTGASNSYIKRSENVFTLDKAVVEREYNDLQQNKGANTNSKVFSVLFDEAAIASSRAGNDSGSTTTPATSYTNGLEVSKVPSERVTRLDAATIAFYDALTLPDKLKIDRFIAARYINKDYESANILNADLDFEKTLNRNQKSYVKLLSKSLKEQSLSKAEKSVLSEAFVFYNNEATNAKPKWNRLVLSYALDVRSGGVYMAKRKDYAYYGSLSSEEKGYVKQIEDFRRTNHRILSENIKQDAKDVVLSSLIKNIPEYIVKTEKMTIEGELVDNQSGKAVEAFEVALENKSGKQVYQTSTNEKGEFAFKSIDSDDGYKLVSASPEYAEKFEKDYFIKDLKINEVEEGDNSLLLTNSVLFFDTDSKSLRPESRVGLDEIATAYKKGEFTIELDSHTDDDGNKSYNEILSKDRGFATKNYLVSKGVSSSDVVIRFFGSEKPVTSNDNIYGKQFNRRVDITLKSKSKIPYTPPLVYLAKPMADIKKLANRYKITVNQLMKLNGLKSDKLQPYKPVRLPNINVSPDLTQVVPLNVNVLNLSTYKVRAGETVTSIADKLRVPEELLYELNNLTSDYLKPGTNIIVMVRSQNP